MINIYSTNSTLKYSLLESKGSTYQQVIMTTEQVNIKVTSTQLLNINRGDYLEYNSKRFYFRRKSAAPSAYRANGYQYDLSFFASWCLWADYPMLFQSAPTLEADWTLSGSTPAVFMNEVIANISDLTGDTYTYSFDASLQGLKDLSFSNVSIFEALNQIAKAFDTEWWVEGTVIHISKQSIAPEIVLITDEDLMPPTSVQEDKEFTYANRFIAFGGTRNVEQTSSKIANSSLKNRLTLNPVDYPHGYKDISSFGSEEEIIYKILFFDDIYPRAAVTIGNVGYTIRTDKTVIIGHHDNGNPIYKTYPAFMVTLNGYTYNEANLIPGLSQKIAFKDGFLAGREFELSKPNAASEFEILIDESSGFILPNLTLPPVTGNNVVIFNIKMPSIYTTSAQTELETALNERIEEIRKNHNSYTVRSIPAILRAKGTTFSLGQQIEYHLSSATINNRITKITQSLDNPFDVELELGSKVQARTTASLRQEIKEVNDSLDIATRLAELQKETVNSYARAQKEIADGMALIGGMWTFDKTLDTTHDKSDPSKWAVYSQYSVYSKRDVSSYGIGGGASGGTGGLIRVVHPYTDINDIFADTDLTTTFNAYTITRLATRITDLENADIPLHINRIGTGNAVTSVTLSGNTLSVTKGANYSLATHTHSQYSLASHTHPNGVKHRKISIGLDPAGNNSAGFETSIYAIDETLNLQKQTDGNISMCAGGGSVCVGSPISNQSYPFYVNGTASVTNLHATNGLQVNGVDSKYDIYLNGMTYTPYGFQLHSFVGSPALRRAGEPDGRAPLNIFRTIVGTHTTHISFRCGESDHYRGIGISTSNELLFGESFSNRTMDPWLKLREVESYFTNRVNALNIFSRGSVTAQYTSDRRLKENFKSFDASKLLLSLGEVTTFDYNELAHSVRENTPDSGIGLLWQDVIKVLPQMDARLEGEEYGSLNYLHPDYINLIAATAQENAKKVEQLERENKELKTRLAKIEKLLNI